VHIKRFLAIVFVLGTEMKHHNKNEKKNNTIVGAALLIAVTLAATPFNKCNKHMDIV
jgi:hypothetical protein